MAHPKHQQDFKETSGQQTIITIQGADPVVETTRGIESESVYYYADQYEAAGKAVDFIVQRTVAEKRNLQKSSLHQSPIHNVVSFLGRRGTGKTSAVESFSALLAQHVPGDPSNYLHNNGRFFCLGCIDGSLLEPGEDVIKVILAQMYREYKSCVPRPFGQPDSDSLNKLDRQELEKQFDGVFQKLQKLSREGSRDYVDSISPIVSLKNLSGSLEIRSDLEKLIQLYVRVRAEEKDEYCSASMRRGGIVGNRDEYYLVIPIDDLDLNIPFGFEMLEKINRYLMLPNVIILLAMDYEQLSRLCEKHFYQMTPLVDSKLNSHSDIIQNLAKDYLDKVMPADARIYLPPFNLRQNVRVKVDDAGKIDKRTPKAAIFDLLFQKLGLRMDIAGDKRHFFEPETFRTYVSFYLMLDSMEDALGRNSGGVDLGVFEHNYWIMYSNICDRMANEMLDEHDRSIFRQIITERRAAPRSFRNLYTFIQGLLQSNPVTSKTEYELGIINEGDYWPFDKLKKLVECASLNEYSYGEVLRIIYYWGRVNKRVGQETDKFILNKPIIHCLLAYFSLEMLREFVYLRYGTKEQAEPLRINLLETLNGSFAGSWANRMIPLVLGHGLSPEQKATLQKRGDRKRLYLPDHIGIGAQVPSIGCRTDVQLDIVFSVSLPENLKSQKEIETVFQRLVVLSMFFDQPNYKNEEMFTWTLDLEVEREAKHDTSKAGNEEKQKDFKAIAEALGNKPLQEIVNGRIVHIGGGQAVFNILNVVSNAFIWENNLDALFSKKLLDTMESVYKISRRTLEAAVRSVRSSFEKWNSYAQGFVLPFYDVDLCYNLAKRIRQRRYGGAQAISDIDVYREIREIFKYIANALAKNDAYYEGMGAELLSWKDRNKQTGPVRLQDSFMECPYVKWFLDFTAPIVDNKSIIQDYSDEAFVQDFNSMIILMLLDGPLENSKVPFDERQGEKGNFVIGYDD